MIVVIIILFDTQHNYVIESRTVTNGLNLNSLQHLCSMSKI